MTTKTRDPKCGMCKNGIHLFDAKAFDANSIQGYGRGYEGTINFQGKIGRHTTGMLWWGDKNDRCAGWMVSESKLRELALAILSVVGTKPPKVSR